MPESVLCSSALRAQQTLERLTAELGQDIPAEIERQLYLADAEQLLRRLHKLDDAIGSVLVIGHNPTLQNLAVGLAGTGNREDIERLSAAFPTAALAALTISGPSWKDLGPGEAVLKALVTPKDLA